MRAAVLLFIVFMGGCASAPVTSVISQDKKDVLILSGLIRDHLRKTGEREIDLIELLKKDTLNRISNSFELVELRPKGNIFVYFKFSEQRNTEEIELNRQEMQWASRVRWRKRKLGYGFDGAIRFKYGERFYLLTGIFIQKGSKHD
jgi:hypothetical protein